MTIKTFIALHICLSSLSASGSPVKAKTSAIKIDGCALLHEPAKFNGKQVEVEGLAYGAFESFSLSFECPGYLHLEQSLYEPDIRKFGFRTVQDGQMNELTAALFPNPDINARESHHARVRLIGFFRCHYDFPDCKNISVHGDSSIVIRSILSVEKADNPKTAAPYRKE